MNFSDKTVQVEVPQGTDALTNETVDGKIELTVNGVRVIRLRNHSE